MKIVRILLVAACMLGVISAFAQYKFALKKAKNEIEIASGDLSSGVAIKSFKGGNGGFMVDRIKMDCSSVDTRYLAIAEKLTDCHSPLWYADNASCQIKIETPASETNISYEPPVWIKPDSGQLIFVNFQGLHDCKISVYGSEVWE